MKTLMAITKKDMSRMTYGFRQKTNVHDLKWTILIKKDKEEVLMAQLVPKRR